MQSESFQFGDQLPWQDLNNGLQRQLFGYDDKVMMLKIKFEAGAVGAMHDHPHSQVTYIETGLFDMTIDGVTKRLKAGDGYYVPPHARHGITCVEAGMLVDVFSPHREDFLG
ncbi:MAG TPA: cupin domain-containing protein [Chitinophagaceae bacterium]|nr:cupin domain-containing protein [Chitinophagaceae bacterium]